MLPCVSLYMQELHSHKHTHVRKECSLLCSFGSGISYSNRKVIKRKPRRRIFNLFVFHSKNYYLWCDLCLSGFSSRSCFCFFSTLRSSLHCSHLVKQVFVFFQMLIRPPDCAKLAPLGEEKIGAAMMQGPKPEPQHVIHYIINYPVRAALHGGHLITRH